MSTIDRNLRFLVFAFACRPELSSEPGVGFNWSRALARIGETWVITLAAHREAIESKLWSIPEKDRLNFIYVGTASPVTRPNRLYGRYLRWQIAAVREALRLRRKIRADVVWHLTMTTGWFGSLAPLVPADRFISGPLGGGVPNSWRLIRVLGTRGAAFEVARSVTLNLGWLLNPLVRLMCMKSQTILVANPETRDRISRRHRSKAMIVPQAVLEHEVMGTAVTQDSSRARRGRTALFAARLIPWKGAALAIRAIAHLDDWRLMICGDGPDRARLQRLTRQLGIQGRVQFAGVLPRSELLQLMHEADVFLLPSLHDDCPWAIAEAVAMGTRTIALDRGGSPFLGAHCVPVGNLEQTVRSLVQAVELNEKGAQEGPEVQTLDVLEKRLRAILI